METDREIENFVSVYGTGSQIPDPPAFVNYQLPDATPSSSSQPTYRYANFGRSSARDVPLQLHRNSTYIPPPQQDEEPINTAGRGAGGGGPVRRTDTFSEPNNLARQPTQRNSLYGGQQQQQPYVNGNGSGHSPTPSQNYQNYNAATSSSPGTPSSSVPLQRKPTNAPQTSQTQSSYRSSLAAHDPLAEPIDPSAETYIKVGNHAYRADPSKDPQVNSGPSGSGSGPASRNNGTPSSASKQNAVDPLQKQLEELQNVVSASGSSRRNTVYRGQATNAVGAGPSGSATAGPSHTKGADSLSVGAPQSLSPPATSPSPGASGSGSQPVRDYRNSAELVVGAPPPVASRPASPNPPTANFMIPKNTAPPAGGEVVQEVLADYHQSLPGERKAISGSTSRRGSFISQHMQSPSTTTAGPSGSGFGHGHSLSMASQHGQTLGRPPSVGHAGIGAHGGHSRSNSPQPPSRGPSPGLGEIVNVNNMTGQPPQQPQQQRQSQYQHPPQPQQQPQQQQRNSAYITPPSAGTPVRTTSPNPVGIALDPSGRVSHDEMAQRYQMQQQQQQQPRGQTPLGHQPHQQSYGGVTQQQQQQQNQQRRSSYLGGANASGPSPASMAPPVQPLYSPVTPPPPPPQAMNMYQVPPPPQQQPQQGYMQPGPGAGQQGMYGQYTQQPYQQHPAQQPQQSAYAVVNGQQQRAVSGNGAYPSQGQSSNSLAVRGSVVGGGGYRAASPVGVGVGHIGRSPSPQPMAQQMPPHVQQVPQVQQMQMQMGHQPMQQQPPQQMSAQGQQMQVQGRFAQHSPQQQIGQTTEDGQPILFYGALTLSLLFSPRSITLLRVFVGEVLGWICRISVRGGYKHDGQGWTELTLVGDA